MGSVIQCVTQDYLDRGSLYLPLPVLSVAAARGAPDWYAYVGSNLRLLHSQGLSPWHPGDCLLGPNPSHQSELKGNRHMAGMQSATRARRALEKLGFEFNDADRSHYHYRAPSGRKITVVLRHREIPVASLRKTWALADVAWSDFEQQH